MEQWKEYIDRLISSIQFDESSIIISEDLDIVSVVESLQPYMTHSDSSTRVKAGKIFKRAIIRKFDTLNEDSLNLLKQFIVQKLDDAAVVSEALAILSLFYEKDVLSESETFSISVKSLKALKAFRYAVENRHVIFKFVHEYLGETAKFPQEDCELFYESYLNAIENEKDPRNLKIIFDTIHFLAIFPMSLDYVEEIFESIFCYFPITFRSNPSDPNLITVDELKNSLARVISGDARFGDLAVSLLIEKLSSTSLSSKIDSLDVLLRASNIYEPISFVQYRYQLEIALFSELTANNDAKIQSKALELVRKISSVLTGDECEAWMNKFLREAITAVELDSREIMSKSAVLIEAVSISNIKSFKYSINFCTEPLLKISQTEAFSIKGQAARNCLVALFSPLKINSSWTGCLNDEIINALNSFFDLFCGDIDSVCIYLVIFSFVSPILSPFCIEKFVKCFLDKFSKLGFVSNEINNCVWLASSSCPEFFLKSIKFIENEQIISALASNSELTHFALKRLLEMDKIYFIEEVISKSDLSKTANDIELVENILSLPISSESIVKLISKCPLDIQKHLILNNNSKLESILIAAFPDAIQECKSEIIKWTPSFKNHKTISSLFNKCPSIDWPFDRNNADIELSAIRGLIYRKDPQSLELLKASFDKFHVNNFAKMFSNELIPELFTSSMSHHTKSSLYLQWLMNYLIPLCDSFKPLALLISVLSICPTSLIKIHSNILPELVLKFLKLCDQFKSEVVIEAEVRKEAWKVLVDLLESSSNIQVEDLIQLAFNHSNLKLEEFSIIRYWAMKLLSKLIEIPSIRPDCFDWQCKVLVMMKSGPLDDPKRAVRQEAARANNLWIVLREDSVFSA